ncbi:MAG: hypothetical protein HQ541_05660 [Mariniphaga sp.]|nr:hypothetical protein [Mariniphaga sp.]
MEVEIAEFTLSNLVVGQKDTMEVDVSIDDIDEFAEISGDYSLIHMDSTFAKAQGFNSRVAHGMLIGALVSGFIGNKLPGRYGILQSIDIGFRKPLEPPDTIQINGEIISISKSTSQIVVKITVSNSKGSKVAIAKVKSIIRINS